MVVNPFHNPLGIFSVGGLGRETGVAAIVNLSYQYGGEWPPNLIYGELDATEDTGRHSQGLFGRLPAAPPRRHHRLILPDVNLRAIGQAAESWEIRNDPLYRRLFETIPPELLAAAPDDTISIGAHQKPVLGTALWILYFDEIFRFVKDLLRELREMAGSGRAEVVIVAGGNGAIGSSISFPLARLVRSRVSNHPQWRSSLVLLGVQPDGQTPDPVSGSAIMYTLLKDLAISSRQG